ncbi:hypothetical protein BV898_09602 [Hypsibius exemplaris]|uniref:Tetraspanin n=1 Tax=Hypsibius exemplaris TaxID=2072580 RepID=A0A1W0WM64_HYPEX|nr:hypothetical protein BV898_09602 [Hypsibius exemplaris]
MMQSVGPSLAAVVDEPDGFRFTNLIDLVFPRWKDAVAHVTPKDYESMGKAMRYYRVWVYISCIVTVIPAIIFACVVGWIFSSDYFRLLPLQAYDWTFLYLYAAVFFQIFINPALGIVGACRLNERLLWAFWGSMVALCLMDAVIGVVWAMKLTHLNVQILEDLKTRLTTYGSDPNFSSLWELLQRTERCCGVNNVSDYFTTPWFRDTNGLDMKEMSDAVKHLPILPKEFMLPTSCCAWPSVDGVLAGNCSVIGQNFENVYRGGCYLALHTWMHAKGDILFVIGYAIMGFIRGSLVFCLYSEIKHFIRKIYIRGVPREMHHASVSVGSDLINFHRHNSSASSDRKKHPRAFHPSNSALPLGSSSGVINHVHHPHSGRAGDGSLRRWSFMRHWKGWSGIASRSLDDDVEDIAPGGPLHKNNVMMPSTSSVKLKSINEENTTML